MKLYKSPAPVRYLLFSCLSLFVFSPLLYVLGKSFQNPIQLRNTGPVGFAHNFFSLGQYQNTMFHSLAYWAGFWNTLILVAPVLALSALFATLGAYGLAVIDGRYKKGIVLLYILLSLLPAQVLLVPNFIALYKIGLIGNRLSVIAISCFSPYYVYFLYRFFSGIPLETLEAARIEGAGEWAVYLRIALPQVKSGLVTLLFISASDLWSMVEQPLAFLQTPQKYPLSLLFGEVGAGSPYAGAILFTVPMLVLFLCAARDLTTGMAGGKNW